MGNDTPATHEFGAKAAQKERIFCAALQVALRKGFGKVTLDAVANEAGLSKGGLLYHFATKGELIRALLVRCDRAKVRGSEVDPLAVAALIAAAEDPSLLAAIAPRLTPEHQSASASTQEGPTWSHRLAKYLQLRGTGT